MSLFRTEEGHKTLEQPKEQGSQAEGSAEGVTQEWLEWRLVRREDTG